MSVISDQNSRTVIRRNERSQLQFYPLRFEGIVLAVDCVEQRVHCRRVRYQQTQQTHEFDNHLTVAVREGLDPSTSLAELADKTETDEQFQAMAASTFSRYTNDRAVVAVVRFLFEVLHTPQLSHQRAVQRKQLEWLTRGVGAVDATTLELTRLVVVSDEFVGDDKQSSEIDTEDGGLELHCAARVDGEHKHPLGATVTEGDTHESPQCDHLKDDVEVCKYLDSIIWACDRGYTHYHRFCQMTHSDDDFVTLLRSDARLDVLDALQNVEVTDESGTKQIRDERKRIKLAETGEEFQFRRIVLQTPDGEEIESLTTLASSAYDPIDIISIYTLRTVIEILCRELKQYLNIENFHSKSLNGVLFAALIGLILIDWLRQRHPVKGGVPRTTRKFALTVTGIIRWIRSAELISFSRVSRRRKRRL